MLATVAVSILTAIPVLGCITFFLFLPILVFVISAVFGVYIAFFDFVWRQVLVFITETF